MDNRLITEQQVAAMTGLAVKTLQKWRYGGKGDLPYVKLGFNVRYRIADVEKWIAENTVTPGGAA